MIKTTASKNTKATAIVTFLFLSFSFKYIPPFFIKIHLSPLYYFLKLVFLDQKAQE